MVSRYETNVGQAPFDLVVRWLSACGTDLATAIREFANTVDLGGGLDPGRPYELLDRDLILIERHIKTVPPKSLMAMTPGAPNPKKLEELLRRSRKKPTVLLSGKIESGKFRLAKFPVGYRSRAVSKREDHNTSDVHSASRRTAAVAAGTSLDLGFHF